MNSPCGKQRLHPISVTKHALSRKAASHTKFCSALKTTSLSVHREDLVSQLPDLRKAAYGAQVDAEIPVEVLRWEKFLI